MKRPSRTGDMGLNDGIGGTGWSAGPSDVEFDSSMLVPPPIPLRHSGDPGLVAAKLRRVTSWTQGRFRPVDRPLSLAWTLIFKPPTAVQSWTSPALHPGAK